MYKLGLVNPEVIIDLENGVYEFMENSATGKTYLLNMLKMASVKEPVIGYTYSDHLDGSVLMERCLRSKVIMFDRYDMYAGCYKDIILACKDNSIILLDNKTYDRLGLDMGYCGVKLTRGRIEVSE